jgi:hypothetical protein
MTREPKLHNIHYLQGELGMIKRGLGNGKQVGGALYNISPMTEHVCFSVCFV